MARVGYCKHDRYIGNDVGDGVGFRCHECVQEKKEQERKIEHDLNMVKNNFLKSITEDKQFRESIIKVLLLTEPDGESILYRTRMDINGELYQLDDFELRIERCKHTYFKEVTERQLASVSQKKAFCFMISNPMSDCLYHYYDRRYHRIRWNDDTMRFEECSVISDPIANECEWVTIDVINGGETYYIPDWYNIAE